MGTGSKINHQIVAGQRNRQIKFQAKYKKKKLLDRNRFW